MEKDVDCPEKGVDCPEQGVDRLVIMLDNFSPEECKAVSEQMEDQEIREHVVLEASGGIVFNDLKSWHE